MTPSPVIDIRDLYFAHNGQPILEGVNLSVQAGDFVAMIGPNGGGKTTLLQLMLGLLQPLQGSIRIFGRPPGQVSHRIGYVPQNVHINTHFPVTVLDVVLMGLLKPGRRWARHGRRDRLAARRALERLEMEDAGNRRIGELSGGQRQRVFVARAIADDPEILFLDEPTANIDTRGQAGFYDLLRRLNQDTTIIVVSHDLLVLSSYVKSVACVNRRLHYHDQAEITADMLETLYPCAPHETCQVELLAHGLPHRVLKSHESR